MGLGRGAGDALPLAVMGDVQGRAMPSGDERRAFRRAALDRPVLVETSSKTTTARSVNVSGGGLALRTELEMQPGDRVSVYFELPIGYGVETNATVLRREGEVTVVQFVDGPPEAILAIRAFCRVSGLHPDMKTQR